MSAMTRLQAPEIHEPEFDQIRRQGRCPISGLKAILRPGVDHGNYRLDFLQIGTQILVAQAWGHATEHDARAFLNRLDYWIEQCIPDHLPVILIEDYATLDGADMAAQMAYIQGLRQHPRVGLMSYFRPSPFFHWIIKSAKLAYRLKPAVQVHPGYSKAILGALEWGQIPKGESETLKNFPVQLDQEVWVSGACSFSTELYAGPLIVLKLKGVFDEESIRIGTQLIPKVLTRNRLKNVPHLRISDWSELGQNSQSTRIAYSQILNELQKDYPCKGAALIGISAVQRILLSLFRRKIPYPILIASNRDEAMEKLAPLAGRTLKAPVSQQSQELSPDMEELLQFFAEVDFEKPGPPPGMNRVDDSHPLRPVYHALSFLKNDFDLILHERELAEKSLMDAKKQADAANAAKTQFLARMSHELRTPLNGILGMSSLLHDSKLSDDQFEMVDTIHTSAQQLLGIIRDILDYANLEEGELHIEQGVIELPRLLRELAEEWRPKADRKHLDLIIQPALELPQWIRGDAQRLFQVLGHLLSNSIKFTESGSITLSVQKEEDSIVIKVTDTGPGIAPQEIERIFKPFNQADESMNRKFGGAGLGLSISHRIVESMDGQIGVVSQEGHGATFWVKLPWPEICQVQYDPKPETIEENNQLYVLVAEDNPINQKVVLRMLNKIGHKVQIANNGVEALRYLTQEDFDVVLMDVQMPEMDGLEATRRLRGSDEVLNPKIPVIALTAHAQESDRRNCLAAGMNDYLTKPVQLQDLVNTIGHWVKPKKMTSS
jgi:signal transduction histidine kinase/ActR/RegA family two-component response regulator